MLNHLLRTATSLFEGPKKMPFIKFSCLTMIYNCT
jgi:hypothetical protein